MKKFFIVLAIVCSAMLVACNGKTSAELEEKAKLFAYSLSEALMGEKPVEAERIQKEVKEFVQTLSASEKTVFVKAYDAAMEECSSEE